MQTKKTLLLAFLFIFFTTIVVGCTAVRKPETNERTPATRESIQAKNLAQEAAGVDGVKEAYVVITGNTAVVGLDVDRQATEEETNRIKSEVGQRMRTAGNGITDVRVATDPDSVTRIRNIFEGINQGRPLSSFERELTEIIRRIAPTRE